MNDVARLAGVGTMTVSRVLNGSPHVTKATAQRVYSAIEQLDYRPNEMARALRGLRSRTIGLILPQVFDPFFATLAHSIHTIARKHGYSVLLTTSDEDPNTEYTEAQLMRQRHVEGLLVVPADARRSRLGGPEFREMPIVAMDRPATGEHIDSVLVHNQKGARMGVAHLAEVHGHRRIYFLGLVRSRFTIRSRFNGYRREMQERGLKPQFSFEGHSLPGTIHAIERVLRSAEPPTAFFAANNLTTRYLLQALAQLKIQVPGQMAVLGFDDFELADVLEPRLTVVRQPLEQMGSRAAGLLFGRLAKPAAARTEEPATHLVLPVDLVVRRSCGCRPQQVC